MTEPVDTGEDSHSPAGNAARAARPRVSDGTWRWIVLAASALGAIASTVSALISFLPFVPPLPIAGWLFFGVLAIAFGGALRAAIRTPPGKDQASAGPDRDRPYSRFEKRILVAAGLLAVVSVLSSLIATQGGSPDIIGGHYYLRHNSPGGNVEISRAAYLRAIAEGQRVFSGVCAFLYTLIFFAARHASVEQETGRPSGQAT